MFNIWNWIKAKFVSTVKAFLASVFTKAKTEIIAALKDVAVQAVIKLADTDLSNEEKRKAAITEIKAYALARGIQVKDSMLALIVELAVQVVKGE
jgi:surface antigen